MRYSGIIKDDMANGVGVGLVLFSQYCSIRCKSCQNKHTWDKDGGYEFTEDVMNEIIEYFNNTPFANRLTLSGGEIFDNIDLANYVSFKFKSIFPNKSIWIYTGYTYEEIIKRNQDNSNNIGKILSILSLTDVLVDGKFEVDKKDLTLAYRGSSGQRIIDVQKSLKENKVVLFELNT